MLGSRLWSSSEQALQYLGRYTHRIALTNNRLVSLDDAAVRFRYQGYASGKRRKVMSLDAQEFIGRYLLHVLPKGCMPIRYYGLSGNRATRHKLLHARAALRAPPPRPRPQCTRICRGLLAARRPPRHPSMPALP